MQRNERESVPYPSGISEPKNENEHFATKHRQNEYTEGKPNSKLREKRETDRQKLLLFTLKFKLNRQPELDLGSVTQHRPTHISAMSEGTLAIFFPGYRRRGRFGYPCKKR